MEREPLSSAKFSAATAATPGNVLPSSHWITGSACDWPKRQAEPDQLDLDEIRNLGAEFYGLTVDQNIANGKILFRRDFVNDS